MQRAKEILTILIGVLALNGILCPCTAAAASQDASHAAPAADHAGHGTAATDSAEDAGAGDRADDCHSDGDGATCAMPESGDPDFRGSKLDQPNNAGLFALATRPAALLPGRLDVSVPIRLTPHRLKPATPIDNRDRLLI